MTVAAVKCNDIDTRTLDSGLDSFDAVVSRIRSLQQKESQNVPTFRAHSRKPEDRTSNCPFGSKIHAEIQLVLFYEVNTRLR